MTTNGAATPKVAKPEINRRDFLASTAAVGGAMVLGFHLPGTSAQASAVQGQPWYHDATVPEINAWLTIAPDDTVTIRVAQTEQGTGVFTSCPMMVADDLQCDWSKVKAEYASPQRNAVEKAPEWTMHVPGNSDPRIRDGGGEAASPKYFPGVYRRMDTNSNGSVRESRYYLQMAGAEARERLLLAAAQMWSVPTAELTAKDSVVTHALSGRRTTYGALAAKAARLQRDKDMEHPRELALEGLRAAGGTQAGGSALEIQRLWRHLAAGALVGFIASRTIGVLGFVEYGLLPAPQALISVLVEIGALALLAVPFLDRTAARPALSLSR